MKTDEIIFVNYILDNVHGFIGLTEVENKIERLPIFKRLLNISQLGLAKWVFPGAAHNRYIHSLGVMHVIDQMAIHLKFEPHERQIVRVAALLHDIGHYPLSHDGEIAYIEDSALIQEDPLKAYRDKCIQSIQKLNSSEELDFEPKMVIASSKFNHERIGTHVITLNSCICDLIDKYVDCELEDIFAIITGNSERKSKIVKLQAMIQMLHSELDADRIDYLLRDATFTGASYGSFNLGMLMQSLEISQDGNFIVGVKPKGIACVEQFLINRYLAYNQVVFHKYASSLGAMARISCQMMMQNCESTGFLSRANLLDRISSHERNSDYLSFTDQRFFQSINSLNLYKAGYPDEINRIIMTLQSYRSLDLNDQMIISSSNGREIFGKMTASRIYNELNSNNAKLYVYQCISVTDHVPINEFNRQYHMQADAGEALTPEEKAKDYELLALDRLQHGAALIENGEAMLLVDSDASMLKNICGVKFCVLREYNI